MNSSRTSHQGEIMGLFDRFKKDNEDYSENLKKFARDYMDVITGPVTPMSLNQNNMIFQEWREFTLEKDIHDPNLFYANVMQMTPHEGLIKESEECLDLANRLEYYENSDPELNKWFKSTAESNLSRKKMLSDITQEDLDRALDYGRRFKQYFDSQQFDIVDDILEEWKESCPFDPNVYYAMAITSPGNPFAVKMAIECAEGMKDEYVGEDIFLNKWYRDGANQILDIVDRVKDNEHIILK